MMSLGRMLDHHAHCGTSRRLSERSHLPVAGTVFMSVASLIIGLPAIFNAQVGWQKGSEEACLTEVSKMHA